MDGLSRRDGEAIKRTNGDWDHRRERAAEEAVEDGGGGLCDVSRFDERAVGAKPSWALASSALDVLVPFSP